MNGLFIAGQSHFAGDQEMHWDEDKDKQRASDI